MRNELIRKGIHLTMLVLPISYLFLPKVIMLVFIGMGIVFALLVEYARFHIDHFSNWFHGFLGHLLRTHEKKGLTGSTYLLISAFLTILIFEKWIALLALLFMIVSDAFGAMFGKMWGKRFIYKNKSLEGSVVFILTATAFVFLVRESHLFVGIVGVFVACVIEIFVINIDDNLTIPLGSGLIMQILSWLGL